VRQAERILFLEHGALVEEGTHEELMALGGRYARLFTLQAAAYTGASIEGLADPGGVAQITDVTDGLEVVGDGRGDEREGRDEGDERDERDEREDAPVQIAVPPPVDVGP